MPMYEFYCPACNTIFNFLSKTANVTKKPGCPRCGRKLEKRVSLFSFSQKQRGTEALPFKSQQAEAGVTKLKAELDRRRDSDPQDAEQLKKKFERWSGVKLDYNANPSRRTADEETEEEKKRHRMHDPDEPFRDDGLYEL